MFNTNTLLVEEIESTPTVTILLFWIKNYICNVFLAMIYGKKDISESMYWCAIPQGFIYVIREN